jgi:valyl-tRNA synthetase
MELSKNFDHSAAEKKWYQHWLDKNYFHSVPDGREPYTVVIPPPNVTGVLHMGHCLNNTIQDILIRRARMQGKNACWVPGTDHASIATEAKVVQMLREKGIAKSSLSREDFLKYAWEWKEKYGGIILQQLKKLGCSLDWDRTAFTMDDDYYKAVIKVFIDLYKKGMIYRGNRMVNWDPKSKTALSDEEVIFKEVDSKLYYINYRMPDGSPGITVATTRPETILGDVAICVNPNDPNYTHLIGKWVCVPIIDRQIPIIADEYVSADFGTGALKVTPAHDKNDNMLGLKHNLKVIDTLDEEAKFIIDNLYSGEGTKQVEDYVGMGRDTLRTKIAEDINALGQLEKVEVYKSQVGTSERTGVDIEHRISLQWFMDMKKFIAANPDVSAAVADDRIKFHPAKAKNTYAHWMDNIKDWCISRQLWWGQQIPAWYGPKEMSGANEVVTVAIGIPGKPKQISYVKGMETVVCENEEEAVKIFTQKYVAQGNTEAKAKQFAQQCVRQDEDCLDTWFSSWLWPMEVFKGISNPGNKEIDYYYPTTTLVTGQDIIFFWVARMIMAGYEYKKELPFKDVYFTGMVRDKQGRKMSKQLGNSPDLLGLIDQYGADATRFGIMIASPAGNDLLFDESSLEQGRNFNNKIWNALRLVKMWEGRVSSSGSKVSSFAVEWFENRLNEVRIQLDEQFKDFRLSESLKTIYSLIWDDFCSWYLEWIKPNFEQPIDKAVYEKTVGFFEELMQLLHPFMPFITEDIYHQLKERKDDLTVKQYPIPVEPDKIILEKALILKNDITAIRDIRRKNEIKNIEQIEFMGNGAADFFYSQNTAAFNLLQKQTNLTYLPPQHVKDIVEHAKNEIIVVSENRTFFSMLKEKLTSQFKRINCKKTLIT